MIACPNCGSESYRESRQCPKHNGKPVCITCCSKCEFYNQEVMSLACRYYIYHPRVDYEGEIEKTNRKIQKKMQQVRYFYDHSMPIVAAKIENEISLLLARKNELIKEKENRC